MPLLRVKVFFTGNVHILLYVVSQQAYYTGFGKVPNERTLVDICHLVIFEVYIMSF